MLFSDYLKTVLFFFLASFSVIHEHFIGLGFVIWGIKSFQCTGHAYMQNLYHVITFELFFVFTGC